MNNKSHEFDNNDIDSVQVLNTAVGWWPLDLLVADLFLYLSLHQLFLYSERSTQGDHAVSDLAKRGGQALHHSHTHHHPCNHSHTHQWSGTLQSCNVPYKSSIFLITLHSSLLAHHSACTNSSDGIMCVDCIDYYCYVCELLLCVWVTVMCRVIICNTYHWFFCYWKMLLWLAIVSQGIV